MTFAIYNRCTDHLQKERFMPELPDVEVYRRYINDTSLDKRIESVDVTSQRILDEISEQALQRRLKDHHFVGTTRRGKHLFIETDNNGILIMHFGMTGFVQLVEKDGRLPDHTRVSFGFKDNSALAYSCTRLLGKIGWTDDIEDYIGREDLGPDAHEISLEDFTHALTHGRSSVKAALMNQGRIAGLGNVYTDEILYQMGIHPQHPGRELDEPEIDDLYKTMHRVLDVAIRHNAQPGDMPPRYLVPHRFEGEPCPRCGTEIEKVSTGGRSAYFCPQCQA
ncbi:MAG: Fpg/Nei family DNA glycosylase [Chitinivibrionales bacterium]|nr:Fpg/Nei family DNA glycosylase [Chitinivibrionales bacterium]